MSSGCEDLLLPTLPPRTYLECCFPIVLSNSAAVAVEGESRGPRQASGRTVRGDRGLAAAGLIISFSMYCSGSCGGENRRLLGGEMRWDKMQDWKNVKSAIDE